MNVYQCKHIYICVWWESPFSLSIIFKESFAETTNAAITEILQHTAHAVLGKVDPPTPQKYTKSTEQHSANHHSSQNPQEAHL